MVSPIMYHLCMAMDTLNIVSWNILLDMTRSGKEPDDPQYVRPQAERLGSIANTLSSLEIPLDVVVLQEVQKTMQQHNGFSLAQALGYSRSFWHEHNQNMRKGDHIGMFGDRVSETEVIELPHNKKAVGTKIGELAIAGIHLRKELFGQMRAEQMVPVLEWFEGSENAILVGDSNALFFEKSRRMVKQAGFRSAWGAWPLGPGTFPSPEYRNIMLTDRQRRLLMGRDLAIDVMYVRGDIQVESIRRFIGDSDHYGLHATVQL